MLSVFNDAKSPGQSFHVRRFLDQFAYPPQQSWITAPTGLFAGCLCSFWDAQPMGSFLVDKSTIQFREALRNVKQRD